MQTFINMTSNLLELFNFIGEKMLIGCGREENIVAGRTIVRECGPNYLVVVDAPYEPNT